MSTHYENKIINWIRYLNSILNCSEQLNLKNLSKSVNPKNKLLNKLLFKIGRDLLEAFLKYLTHLKRRTLISILKLRLHFKCQCYKK